MVVQYKYVFFFNIVMIVTTYIILRLLKNFSHYLPTEDSSLPKTTILFLLGFLAICALIFILNFSYEQSHGFSQEITDANFRLFLIYFTLTAILLVLIAITIYRDAKTKEENSRMKYMEQYTEELEELYWNLRGFKHDYANILYSMKDYMDTNRFDDLKQYYEAEILPGIAALDSNNPAIERLGNIKVPEVKSILYIKIMEAAKKNVRVDLEVKWPIEHISMSALDISRLLGILLDNAIEAALTLPDETEHAVRAACIRTDIGIVIIIKNPTADTGLALSQLSLPSASTKGKDHGMGLYNADKIIAHYDNAILTTEKTENAFSQTLEILDDPS
jgi:two-component system sensor histidine kinase AgrC